MLSVGMCATCNGMCVHVCDVETAKYNGICEHLCDLETLRYNGICGHACNLGTVKYNGISVHVCDLETLRYNGMWVHVCESVVSSDGRNIDHVRWQHHQAACLLVLVLVRAVPVS